MLPSTGHVRSRGKGVAARIEDVRRWCDWVVPGPIEATRYQDLAVGQERGGCKLTGRGQLARERREGIGGGIVKHRVLVNGRAGAAATGDQNHAILKQRGGRSRPLLAGSHNRSRSNRIRDRGC